MDAIAASARRRGSECHPQSLANTSWAYATRDWHDRPLRAAIAAASLPKISDFKTQNVANSAWALSALMFLDLPLSDAIAAASLRTISATHADAILSSRGPSASCQQQRITSSAWAVAALYVAAQPLLHAISASSRSTMELGQSDQGSTAWAIWSLSVPHRRMPYGLRGLYQDWPS